jgi:hypothetical protein
MEANPRSFIFKGNEIISSRIRMYFKMFFILILAMFIIQMILVGGLSWKYVDLSRFHHKTEFMIATVKEWANPDSTIALDMGNGSREIPVTIFRQAIWEIWKPGIDQMIWYVRVSSLLYLLIPIILMAFKNVSVKVSKKLHLRGPQLISARELNQTIANEKEPTDLHIGDVLLPKSSECQHYWMIGTTGVGKSTGMNQVLKRLIERNEQVIVYDFKGEYLSKWFNPETDLIYNPLDARSLLKWTVFNEFWNELDFTNFVTSIVPPGTTDAGVYFNAASRGVLKGILYYLWINHRRTNKDVWKAITAPPEEILAMLRSTELGIGAARHIEQLGERQSQGVLSTLESFGNAFYYLAKSEGDFSIKDWISKGSGRLFLSNWPESRESLRSIISLFVDLAGTAILSLPDNQKKIFILLDEFGTIQPLDSLVNLLTLGRSKGASLWLGSQDFGRIKELYGSNITETLQNNCSTIATFRVQSFETADYLEKLFGKREVSDPIESNSMGSGSSKDGMQLGRQKNLETIILSSEIMKLKNMECVVRVQHHDPALTKIPRVFFQSRHEPFILAPWLKLEGRCPQPATEQPPMKPDANPLDF